MTETECVDIRNNVFCKPGPATQQAHKQVRSRIAKIGIYPLDFGIKLDPNDARDGSIKTIDSNGIYTNLEMYLNSLVEDIIEKQNQ